MLFNVIPHFWFAFILWVLMATVPEVDYAPFKQEEYLLYMGTLKYVPIFLFSIIGSHWISKNMRRDLVISLAVLTAFVVYCLGFIKTLSFQYLSIYLAFMLFSVLYEPVIEILTSYWGETRKSFLKINSIVSLARTSARFVGPLLIGFYATSSLKFQLSNIISVLLLIFASMLLFSDFPKHEKSSSDTKGNNFRESLSAIIGNKVSVILLIIYCVFYLGVSYLEYMVTLVDEKSTVTLPQLFSSMGFGFVIANILILFTAKYVNQNKAFFFSLLLTGICLLSLPFLPSSIRLYSTFLIGFGNGFAVSVSLSILQKLLGRKLIGHFAGILETSINLCGLISLGIGYLIFHFIGSSYIFVFDGLVVIASAFIWFFTDKTEVQYG